MASIPAHIAIPLDALTHSSPTGSAELAAAPAPTAWTPHDYPMVMVGLSLDVREHAIEMANALRSEGLSEQRAIALSVARACDGLDASDAAAANPIAPAPDTHQATHATRACHILYEHGAWRVLAAPDAAGAPAAARDFATLDEALRCAHELARADDDDGADGGFYVYVDQTLVTDPVECFGRRWLGGPALFHVEPWEGGWTVRRIAGDSRFFESLDDADTDADRADHQHSSTARQASSWLWDRLTGAHRGDAGSRAHDDDSDSSHDELSTHGVGHSPIGGDFRIA